MGKAHPPAGHPPGARSHERVVATGEMLTDSGRLKQLGRRAPRHRGRMVDKGRHRGEGGQGTEVQFSAVEIPCADAPGNRAPRRGKEANGTEAE